MRRIAGQCTSAEGRLADGAVTKSPEKVDQWKCDDLWAWALQVTSFKVSSAMRKYEGIASFTPALLFGRGCATETAITEMVRSLKGFEGSHAGNTTKDIRRAVRHCVEGRMASTGAECC